MKKEQHNFFHEGIATPHQANIKVVQSEKSKRLRLTFNIALQQFTLTAPNLATSFDIQSFLKRSDEWMKKQLEKPRPTVPVYKVMTGNKISILGKEYTLICKTDLKKSVLFLDDHIEISGPPSSFSKSLETSLKDMIQKILYQRCLVMAKCVGRTFLKVTVKETKTRWGSCSSRGNLNFSWRLIFAPSAVVDYLCAHEVAHLVEMNHSVRFWSIVKTLHPEYEQSRSWLKIDGKKLLYISFHTGKTPQVLKEDF